MVELPSYDDMQVALLGYLAAHGPCVPKDVYGPLADEFGLSPKQRAISRADIEQPIWNNRVQWTRQKLKNQGLLSPRLRVWELSDAGLKAAKKR